MIKIIEEVHGDLLVVEELGVLDRPLASPSSGSALGHPYFFGHSLSL